MESSKGKGGVNGLITRANMKFILKDNSIQREGGMNLDKRIFGVMGLVVLALLLVLSPILGCAPAAPPVPKPDKVVIHHFGDLSGPYAAITAPIVSGFKDFAVEFNTTGGGIDGVPITDVFRDTGGKLDAALAAYAAFKESKPYPIVTLLYGSAESEALRERFIEDKIVCFTNSPSPTCIYPPGYEFSTIPSYTDSFGAFIDWVSGDWAVKTGQKAKLAILTWDTTFGKAILVDETRNYAAKKGVEIVYEGVYKMTDLDVSTQMTAIKGKGANWVYNNTLAHGPKVVAGAAAALGMLTNDPYDTTAGKVHVANGPWGMDESAIALLGALGEGIVGPRSFASWSMPEVEGIKAATAAFEKNNRKPQEKVMGYLAAWSEVYTVCDAMKKVVAKSGWGKFDGAAVKDQFLKTKDFSPQGMTLYTFTAEKPEPTKTRIFNVKGGKLLPLTEYVTCPDLRPAQPAK